TSRLDFSGIHNIRRRLDLHCAIYIRWITYGADRCAGPLEILKVPMHQFTRREFLGSAVALGFTSRLGFAEATKLRIGVTDWNLQLGANPDALPLAARLGFDGLQVSFGRKIVDDKMPADNPDVVARYVSLSKQYKIPIDGTCVDRLHDNGLKSDQLAPTWVL